MPLSFWSGCHDCGTVLTGGSYNDLSLILALICIIFRIWLQLISLIIVSECAPLLILKVLLGIYFCFTLLLCFIACWPNMTASFQAFHRECCFWCSDGLKLLRWLAVQNHLNWLVSSTVGVPDSVLHALYFIFRSDREIELNTCAFCEMRITACRTFGYQPSGSTHVLNDPKAVGIWRIIGLPPCHPPPTPRMQI